MEQNLSQQLNQLKILVLVLAVLCINIIGYVLFGSSASPITEKKQDYREPTAADHAAKIVEEIGYSVNGTVVNASPTSITVKADIVDDSKLASLDYSKSNLLETIEKTLAIDITKNTKISGTPKAGDMVMIQTNESIYRSSKLTAATVEVAKPIDSWEKAPQ